MTDLQSSLSALLDLFEKHDVRVHQQLKPLATEAKIAELEAIIGMERLAEVKELYLIANGQISPFVKGSLPIPLEPSEWVGNLFGSYEFLSLEEADQEQANWVDLIEGASVEDLANFNKFITVCLGGNVHRQCFKKSWLPVAKDGGGNAYTLDLGLLEGGTCGQLIVMGLRHAYIRKATPQLNGKVERSHRSDQQEFYQLLSYKDDVDLVAKLNEWENFYNFHRPHGAFAGKTPYEVLREKL